MKNLPKRFLKFFLKCGVVLALMCIVIGSFSVASAATTANDFFSTKCTGDSCPFTFLAPIDFPGFNIEDGRTDVAKEGAARYLEGLYKFGIAIAAALAVIMITIGGVQYSSTDAIQGKSDGKQRITAALTGLILALLAYTILNTINSNFVSNRFEPVVIAVDPSIAGRTQINAENAAVTAITGAAGAAGGVGTPGTPALGPLGSGSATDGTPDAPPTRTGTGWAFATNNPSIDTDGTEPPPFNDPDYQSQTSLAGLNANTDFYVVVPIGSDIPLNTRVTVVNNTTGQSAQAIVGDRGPVGSNREISLALARQLGVWEEGMGNAAKRHSLSFTYGQ